MREEEGVSIPVADKVLTAADTDKDADKPEHRSILDKILRRKKGNKPEMVNFLRLVNLSVFCNFISKNKLFLAFQIVSIRDQTRYDYDDYWPGGQCSKW